MNETTNSGAPAQGADRDRGALRREMIEILRLAVPMAATQVGQTAMMTTDLALIGRLGESSVAGAALAHTVLFIVFSIGLGISAAVAPLGAQALGAREPREVQRTLHTGLWAALLLSLPITVLLMLFSTDLLILFGQPRDSAEIAGRYLMALSWMLPPSWAFLCIRSFMGAVGKPEPALWITLAAVPLNGLLAYGLIQGSLGLPKLDVLGAGVATAVINWGMLAAGIVVVHFRRPYRKYRVLSGFHRYDPGVMRKLLRIGLPVSASMVLEIGLFSSAAFLAGWLDTSSLAAHQITLQVTAVIFMIPLGIAMAATVRVGHAVGRKATSDAAKAAGTSLLVAIAIAVVITILTLASREFVPALFLGTRSPSNGATYGLAVSLLVVASTFMIADAIQVVAAGALRGFSDTRVPFLMAMVSFWLVGFPVCYLLAFPAGLGAHGIWFGLSAGVFCYAGLLVWRLYRFTR